MNTIIMYEDKGYYFPLNKISLRLLMFVCNDLFYIRSKLIRKFSVLSDKKYFINTHRL